MEEQDELGILPQRLSKKELRYLYGVSYKTICHWLSKVKDLGEPDFGRLGYSRNQIAKIYDHLGTPEKE